MQLIIGFGLGVAMVASLALPGKFVIAEQPAMRQVAIPRAPSPVVVDAAPIPRARVHPARPLPQAFPAQPAAPRIATPSSVARTQPSVKPPTHRVRTSRPAPATDESLSTLGVSSSEPEKPKKQKAPKTSPRTKETKKPKKAKAEKADTDRQDKHNKENRGDEKRGGPKDK